MEEEFNFEAYFMNWLSENIDDFTPVFKRKRQPCLKNLWDTAWGRMLKDPDVKEIHFLVRNSGGDFAFRLNYVTSGYSPFVSSIIYLVLIKAQFLYLLKFSLR